MNCKICSGKIRKIITFTKGHLNENLFGLEKKKFKRSIFNCKNCGHYTNIHNYSSFMKKVYKRDYSKYSYGKVLQKFESIRKLPKKKSSNFFRCKFINKNIKKKEDNKILDIGAGFGIFAYSMKKKGWNVVALEINKELNNFISNKLKIKTIGLDIIKKKFSKNLKFSMVTLNKVLEHFTYKDAKKVLIKIKNILRPNGCIYIEVPDGEAAAKKGLHRQEFFLEHHNIFSKKSIRIFLEKLNLKIHKIKKLKEINGKFTLRIIAQNND